MKRYAFTMIELVFIIVILGILGAIAVPKMAASRDDAYAVSLKTDFATLTQAVAAHMLSQNSEDFGLNDAAVYTKERWEAIPVLGFGSKEYGIGTKLTATGEALSANYHDSCGVIMFADGYMQFHIKAQDHTPGRERCNVLRAFFGGNLGEIYQEDIDLRPAKVAF